MKCGPLTRFASLMRSVAREPKPDDLDALHRHGFKEAAFGADVPTWIKKYCADALRFIEFERTALPCALMRPSDGQSSLYTFSSADMDARCVMEQRIQSLICCVSLIRRVLKKQQSCALYNQPPLKMLAHEDAVHIVLGYLSTIPSLLRKYLLHESFEGSRTSSSTAGISSGKSSRVSKVAISAATDGGLSIENRETIQTVADEIDEMLLESSSQPAAAVRGLRYMNHRCLEVREKLLTIKNFGTPTARLVTVIYCICY